MADDSGVEVGGDGSVMWTVRTASVRRGSICNEPLGENGYLQSGINETSFDKPFTIGLKVPQVHGKALAEALRAAAEDAERHANEPGYRVKFPLVIEPKNVDQITITWESTPAETSGEPEDRLGSLIDKVKKVVRKVTGRKAPPRGAVRKPGKKAAVTKAAAKKTPAKKTPAKKAPAKKAKSGKRK